MDHIFTYTILGLGLQIKVLGSIVRYMAHSLREELGKRGWLKVEIIGLEEGENGWEGVTGYDAHGGRYKLLPAAAEPGIVPMAVMANEILLWRYLTRNLTPNCRRLMGPAVNWLGRCEVEIDKKRMAAWMEWETGWV